MTEPVKTPEPRPSDAFIRHVAHDLRASLNAVVGWAELVKAGPLSPEDLTRAGETILRHSRHLSNRIGDALDLWRLDVGLLTVEPRPGPVLAAVRAAIEMSKPAFVNRRVRCDLDVDVDGIGMIDSPRFAQAIAILLGDAAANTTAENTVVVRVGAEAAGLIVRIVGGGRMLAPGGFERSVRDTRSEAGARPFDFALSLAHTLIALQGGDVMAEAVEGSQVAFVVCVPAIDSAAKDRGTGGTE